jgi:cytochrome oxidase Cu insertion factor (SCO1/SenC/PrrC family)
MNATPKTPSKHTKLILLLFTIIIMGPVLVAYAMVQKSHIYQFKMSHHGDLISPPFNIAATKTGKELKGRWWLVYVSPPKCQETCHDVLYNMRQIHTALGKNTSRLERLFIAHPHCPTSVCEQFLGEYYPQMKRLNFDKQEFDNLFGKISNNIEKEMVGELYIIDPKGNIMMHYSADTHANGILSDLKRLLRVSKIG